MIKFNVAEFVSIAAIDDAYCSPSVSNHPTVGVPHFRVLFVGSATISVYL